MISMKQVSRVIRSLMPLAGTSHKERMALSQLLPHMRQSGWLKSIQTRQAINENSNPVPWISYAAINFLSGRVRPEFEVFEYGSGNSTLWWAKNAGRVVSCEHDEVWYTQLKGKIPEGVTYVHESLESGRYPSMIKSHGHFDIVMIDGRERVECSNHAITQLKDGGVIVFDNSERARYQPAFDLFRQSGFKKLDFVSMGPISQKPISTSVFYRSNNCLGI